MKYPVCLPFGLAPNSYPVYATVTTTSGQTYASAVQTLILRDMQVSLLRPPEAGYLGINLPVYEGAATVFEATASSTGAAIARVDFHETWNPTVAPIVLASASAAPWRATWTSTLRSGFRTFIACAYDVDLVRSCAYGNGLATILPAVQRNSLTLSGTSTAQPAVSYPFTVTPTMGTLTNGIALTVTNVALFDADTRVKLAESATPTFVFNLTLNRTRRLIAALQDSSGYETLSNVLTVTSTNQPPAVEISRPVTGSEFQAGSTVPIVVTGSDTDGAVSRIELWRVSDNASPDTLLASADAAATLTYPFTLPSTTQTIRLYAYVTDNAGARTKSAITTITVRADITDPRYFVWTNMNAALKAGNKTAALEFLSKRATAPPRRIGA